MLIGILGIFFGAGADPEAELYYNDYGMDGKAKRDKVVELVKMLKDRGCSQRLICLALRQWPPTRQPVRKLSFCK